MAQNVIILTSGLTGSSVLTGLICQAGYWSGDSTVVKEDYDTYENKELVDLNLKLIDDAGYAGNYLLEFSDATIRQIAGLVEKIDLRRYAAFVDKCKQHRPWIWKDPRLWLTIRFWSKLIDLNDCTFIVLTRGYLQGWISQTLRRQIKSYGFTKTYEKAIVQSAVDFLKTSKLPYLRVSYENLIARPAETINALNVHLGTKLTVDDLKKVYHKELYRSPKSSWLNHAKAVLIYIKNYSERTDIKGVSR
jgi:hypothetical protein